MPRPVPVPWPLSTSPGERPQNSAGRLINAYAVPFPADGPAVAEWKRVPGLTSFASLGATGFRGGLRVVNTVYAVVGTAVKTINSAASVGALTGSVLGTAPITIAANNLSPTPNVIIVDPDNGAFLISGSAVASYTASGNLPAPNSVAFQDGYFFFTIADGRVFASGINDTTVNTQTFTTIQSRARDSLLRGIAFGGMMLFFKTGSCEIYNNTAQEAPAFPYSRLAVLDRGLVGRNAIAGGEHGFGHLLWAADDYGVYRLNSLQPEKVSPPELDRLIKAAALTDPDSLHASCYVDAGRAVWVISSPDWTWEFNVVTEKWNERSSVIDGIWGRWRAIGSFRAFDERWFVGDSESDALAYVDGTNYRELGEFIRWRMESGPVKNFPNRMVVGRSDFDFVTGVGITDGADTTETDPQVGISWSNDDGVRWGNPLMRGLGQAGDAKKRVYVLNTGTCGPAGRRWRLDVSDPVYTGFRGATMSADPRAF